MKNTTLCYIEKDCKYLMLHRIKKENDENRDKWIGVGGKLEEKESPYDCIKREIKEETGLTVNDPRYRGVITFVSDKYETEIMHLFWTDNFSGDILKECDEGELCWIDKRKLLELPIWEGDKIFLKLIDSTNDFFSLKLVYNGDKLIGYYINE